MKRLVLASALLVMMAVAAEAQVSLTYQKQSKERSLTINYSSGYGLYGGWGGYGYSGFGPGFVGNFGGGTLAFGVRHVFPTDFGYGYGVGYGIGSGYGYPLEGYYPYGLFGGGRGYPLYGRPVPMMDYSPLPGRSGGVSDRLPELASAREIEEGRRRFRMGDYRGGLDAFRSAVTTHTSSPLAQAWFALALAVTGDGKNADKALRGAAEALPAGKISLVDLFRDDKERTRVMTALGKMTGDGALAASWVLSLAGEPERLKKLAEKDPAARKLLP